jgi:outer membrane protein OmpA-like peptidoglycan-associated protein
VEQNRVYNDLSSNSIINDSVEYTIYDEITLAQALLEREDRTKSYEEALVAAKKEQEEILKDFGLIADIDTLNVEVYDMLFEIRQFETQKYDDNINTLADYMKENPEAKIEVGGYTDLLGTIDYNRKLAQKRAQFVKKNLVAKGVSESQIVVKNYNIANPIAHNKTSDGEFLWNALPYNRRVEIKVIKQGEIKKLLVKTIDVPDEYSIDNENVSKNPVYSINIITSDSKIDNSKFQTLKNVKERKADDGTYIYYKGEYKTEAEAQKDLQTIRKSFPNAMIFIKEF